MSKANKESRGLMKRPLVMSAALAGVAVLLGHVYLRRYETQLSGGDRVAVVYLTKKIAAGEVLSDKVLSTRMVPLAYVDERDVQEHDLSKVVGIQASFDLPPQQTLQWSDLAVRPDSRQVSTLVVPGKRAVSVVMKRMDAAIAQLVRPGDYVDIVATIQNDDGHMSSTVLLQRVLIVAVGDKTERTVNGEAEERRRGDLTLTFSLDIEESQLLALAQSQGELSIAVRNAGDQRLLENIPDLRASNLIEAQQAMVARRAARARPTSSGPVKLTEAR